MILARVNLQQSTYAENLLRKGISFTNTADLAQQGKPSREITAAIEREVIVGEKKPVVAR